MEELLKLGIDPSESVIRSLLADSGGKPEARYWSAIALGQSKSSDAAQILERLMKVDTDNDVRIGAIKGLAFLGSPQALSLLEHALQTEPSQSIRSSIVSSLYVASTPGRHAILRDVAIDSTQPLAVRVNALEVTGLVLDDPAANTMRLLLVDHEPEIRARAAVALSRHSVDEVLSFLVTSALDDEVPLHVWHDVLTRLQKITGNRFTTIRPIDYSNDPDLRFLTNMEIESWWGGDANSVGHQQK